MVGFLAIRDQPATRSGIASAEEQHCAMFLLPPIACPIQSCENEGEPPLGPLTPLAPWNPPLAPLMIVVASWLIIPLLSIMHVGR